MEQCVSREAAWEEWAGCVIAEAVWGGVRVKLK